MCKLGLVSSLTKSNICRVYSLGQLTQLELTSQPDLPKALERGCPPPATISLSLSISLQWGPLATQAGPGLQ